MHPENNHNRLFSTLLSINPIQLFLVALAICLLTQETVGYIPQNRGAMKMCPPGGEAFAMAWQLTCGMRKKREAVPEKKVDSNTGGFLGWGKMGF